MKIRSRTTILFVIAGAFLAACFSFSPATEAAPMSLQATATLDHTGQVSVELTVQYDTAAVYNTAGQIVRFKYIIKITKNDLNDGTPSNITISGITATCPPINSAGNGDDRFDAGETLECTGDYILTQADIDRGSLTNTATANVYGVKSNTVTTTVPTVPARALTLSKTANPTAYSSAGQQITFTYTIKNSGTTSLGPAQFTVTDSGINNNTAFNCGNANVTLASGATLSCTATYTVTAADMNAASVVTNATASGGGANPSQPVAVTITKSAVTPTVISNSMRQHTVREGEWLWQLARCYGTDPVQTVSANPQLGVNSDLKAGMVVNIPNAGSKGTVHAPPELCVALHTVQSGDTWVSIAQKYNVDMGFLQYVNANTLTTGKTVKVPLYTQGLNYPTATVPGAAPTSTTSPAQSVLSLSVSASPSTYSQAQQIITLNYVIKNNGTTTLGPTQFTISEILINNNAALNCGPASATLVPGATVTCSANYTISQADLNAASITSKATASGSGAPTSAPASAIISKTTSSLTLSVTANPNTYNQAGQTISLIYVVKNAGSATLGPAQFTVTETLLGSTPINCGPADTTLEPNATVTCTGNYTTTQQDMNAAVIQSSATAAGGGVSTSQPASILIAKQ
ncbi:MAG: LysM peptidoglycan-binding domain-containing protein [Chloroflexi bacterium]|nr:LysM peptidoglycan-binding domain-containing protein [Chloroflexota bacterium]